MNESLLNNESHDLSLSAPTVLEKLGFGVVIIDASTHEIVYANSKLLSLSGFSAEEVAGKVCHKLLCPADIGKCPISDLGNSVDNSERQMLLASGEIMPIIKTVIPLKIQGKEYFVESIIDNSERKKTQLLLSEANQTLQREMAKREKMQEDVEKLAYYDHLTGLPNRVMFSTHLTRAISLSKRLEKILVVMFLDLDGFKMINDTLGHSMGDSLLVEVSKRIAESLRESDIIARIGGDEFVILIENIQDIDSLNTIANKILGSFKKPFTVGDQELYITTSIGVALCPTDGDTAESLIKNADLAMYKAKEKGRNQWALCSPLIKNKITETVKLSNNLYRALDRNELELFYQPQINTTLNKIIGFEALIRWNHPELGLVSPGQFIPIAEQTGLIHPIGEWVIRTACRQNKAWQDAGLLKVPVAVNLSVRQFQNPNIVDQIEEILKETGLAPQYLEIEITESIAIGDANYVIEILDAMKKKGISIAIDDFGMEYSSLSYLKQLPVDRIKMAMPFIHGIDLNGKDEAIAKTIIVLARGMGLRLIAEGVETENQLNFLTQRMCNEVQGFYYYRPMPARDLETLLNDQLSPVLG